MYVAWASDVKSGDTSNLEARAAAYYWKNLFWIEGFTRDREGIPPNNLLNYGYAILRAVVARSLVASGLLLLLGIHIIIVIMLIAWQMTSWSLIVRMWINWSVVS